MPPYPPGPPGADDVRRTRTRTASRCAPSRPTRRSRTCASRTSPRYTLFVNTHVRVGVCTQIRLTHARHGPTADMLCWVQLCPRVFCVPQNYLTHTRGMDRPSQCCVQLRTRVFCVPPPELSHGRAARPILRVPARDAARAREAGRVQGASTVRAECHGSIGGSRNATLRLFLMGLVVSVYSESHCDMGVCSRRSFQHSSRTPPPLRDPDHFNTPTKTS